MDEANNNNKTPFVLTSLNYSCNNFIVYVLVQDQDK